jgi:hypothetical protein
LIPVGPFLIDLLPRCPGFCPARATSNRNFSSFKNPKEGFQRSPMENGSRIDSGPDQR